MGILLSRFYDKPTTRDTLERIEQEIQNIEERRWDKIKREQFIVQILSFLPIAILIVIVCILIYPSDSSWRDKLLLCVPIGIINLILWVSKRIVQWYSRWSLDKEEVRLRKLRKEKKKILEMVCETESYRVATELLEKYDPKQLRRREKNVEAPATPLNTTLTKFSSSPSRTPSHQNQPSFHSLSHHVTSPLNQSINFPVPAYAQSLPVPAPAPPPPTPVTKPPVTKNNQAAQSNTSILNASTATATIAASSVQGRPVRPILSKERSLFERMVDWVVADGPDNRFALICRYCYGHNGMSLAEEYETINFRCCYCYNLNTAAQKRQLHDQLQPEREKANKGPSTDKPKQSEDADITKAKQPQEPSGILTLGFRNIPRPEPKKDKSKKSSKNKTTSEEIGKINESEDIVKDKANKEDLVEGDKEDLVEGDHVASDSQTTTVTEIKEDTDEDTK